MKLTRASSYALHAVAYMATQKTDKPVASHKIAADRGIPERFLLKVLKPLVTARVLSSIKGPNGGYKLAKPASDINVLEILEAIDGPVLGLSPLNGITKDENGKPYADSVMAGRTPVNNKLQVICDETAEQVRNRLQKVKVTELLSKR